MEDMDNRRLRLLFEDKDGILSPSQKSEGLKQCWLLLKPQQHKTIADLTAYILHAFQLQSSCPHGLLLYMEGFVLPPFESTGVLKNSDVISVRKKKAVLSLGSRKDIALLEGQEVGNKQPLVARNLFLANEEFQEESGGYLSEDPESKGREQIDESLRVDQLVRLEDNGNATSKKRKSSDTLHGSKKKKRSSGAQDSAQGDPFANCGQNSHQHKIQSRQENILKQKELNPKNEKRARNRKDDSDTDNGITQFSLGATSSDEIQKRENEVPEGLASTEKTSRSSRRKKAKRRWIREMAEIQKQAEISQPKGLHNWKEAFTKADASRAKQKRKNLPAKSERKNDREKSERRNQNDWTHKPAELDGAEDVDELKELKSCSGTEKFDDKRKEQEANQNGNIHEQAIQHSDAEDKVVPVVVRPGHIRFEPLDKGEDVEQRQKTREHFTQWNGITNKKKGQKWGKEKPIYSTRKDNHEYQEAGAEVLIPKDGTGEVAAEVLTAQNGIEEVGAEIFSAQNEIKLDKPIDFDKLPSLCHLPRSGNVIAYRLLELSSSWTPELSEFRVGQVSWSSSESGQLMLMPVPEYPIKFIRLDNDEAVDQPDNSLYKEDGSLEIEFSTLVDVRILKDGSGELTALADVGALSVPSASNEKQSTVALPKNGEVHTVEVKEGSPEENGGNLWEQFSEALSAKKAQLSQKDTLEDGGGSKKSSWSHRTIKGSALGPTMAFLRSNKKL